MVNIFSVEKSSQESRGFSHERFKTSYEQVFDAEGNIKACGRDKCIELMVAADKIKQGDYGNTNTGRLNIENIQDLYRTISV